MLLGQQLENRNVTTNQYTSQYNLNSALEHQMKAFLLIKSEFSIKLHIIIY